MSNEQQQSDYGFVNNSGVQFELVYDKKAETEQIVITIPTYLLKAPTKVAALREERIKGKATGWYTVPKSDSFVSDTKKLKSGHVIMLQIYKRLADDLRKRLYEGGKQNGLQVRPIDLSAKGEEEHANPVEPDSDVVRVKL